MKFRNQISVRRRTVQDSLLPVGFYYRLAHPARGPCSVDDVHGTVLTPEVIRRGSMYLDRLIGDHLIYLRVEVLERAGLRPLDQVPTGP